MVPVVALETVVAREVALERRQDGHAELLGVLAEILEVLAEGGALVLAAPDDESVLHERLDRAQLLLVEGGVAARDAGQQPAHLVRRDELRVREGVHQEHLVPVRQRHVHVESRELHVVSGLLQAGTRTTGVPCGCSFS